ncbi:MAG: type 11 [Chitinophagaceae bacterium]|nr:MAG: type 11 [Chitinophagaceae bacterium]
MKGLLKSGPFLFVYSHMAIKKTLKQIAGNMGMQSALGDMYYCYQFLFNLLQNHSFKKQNPTIPIPPNREIFETFQLNYKRFFKDGELAAKELANYYTSYAQKEDPYILDWGCGVGRITQFIPAIFPKSVCYGADILPKRIQWNRLHLPNIYFDVIEDQQLPYPSALFDLVLGISVFTHIAGNEQVLWLKELYRITKPNAMIIFSTHGAAFIHQLNKQEQIEFNLNGYFTRYYKKAGHRMMTTYNSANHFEQSIEHYFTVLEYYNGKSHPEKLGGQDLWILRKQ